MKYIWDEELNLFRRAHVDAFTYSDGAEVEQCLFDIVRNATDRSTFSIELIKGIKDWPSEYHLSRARHCLVRPLGIKPGEKVLELGCGCGAITRYLGEIGAEVVAVEGSIARARIAAERCRDLSNVKFFVDDLLRFETDECFDWVLLIGVLEYAPVFTDVKEPIQLYLSTIARFLAPNGKLVIAIENKLGLKYFNGCSEDHLGVPFLGIQDLYNAKTPRTFGRRELLQQLLSAGFSNNYFYYPFPDYKLPSVVLSDDALKDLQFDAVDLIIRSHARDYSGGSPYRLFDEALVFSTLSANGLFAEFSNSFLVIATIANNIPYKSDRLAMTFAVNRIPEFSVITNFYRSDDVIHVVKESVFPDFPRKRQFQDCFNISNMPSESIYHPGRQMLWRLLYVRANKGILDQVVAELRPWVIYLLQFAAIDSSLESSVIDAKERHSLKRWFVPGTYLDCTPFNLIESTKGLIFIDNEWQADCNVPLGWVITRGVLHSLSVGLAPGNPIKSVADVIQGLCISVGLSITESEVTDWFNMETRFQSLVTGQELSNMLISPDHSSSGLICLTQALAERDKQIVSLNQAVAERDKQIVSLNQAVAERDKQIVSLNQAVAERDKQIVSLNQAVAERDKQIVSLNQAVAERDKQIAGLNQAVAERDGQIALLNATLEEKNQQLVAVYQSTSWRITRPIRAVKKALLVITRFPGYTRGAIYNVVRWCYRRLPVNSRRKLRWKGLFFYYCGRFFKLPGKRWYPTVAIPPALDFEDVLYSPEQSTIPAELRLPGIDLAAYFCGPAEQVAERIPAISRLMYYIWSIRPDLREAFDLHSEEGRNNFCVWFISVARHEYALKREAYPDDVLAYVSTLKDANLDKAVKAIRAEDDQRLVHAVGTERSPKVPQVVAGEAKQVRGFSGANLIGYARGEFGLGEHVRMTASALDSQGTSFSILDFEERGFHGKRDRSVDHWISNEPKFAATIFHINADLMPTVFMALGSRFFESRLNIGYWAWELPNCPPEFDLAFKMVDEVWAISEFVRNSFAQRSPVPVINMPLCVSLPKVNRQYLRKDFKLPEDSFCFLYSFDSASYLDRKNPIGTVRAFKSAFPKRTEKVLLLLKTMNLPESNPYWTALCQEIQEDPRIRLISSRWMREELLGLYTVCDCFVSLHRSEGFGRGPAEAMLLGKPVIVTNYSGTTEFAREDTACVVDYELIPVSEGQYPFWQGQVWADPDVEQAAWYMKRLVTDFNFTRSIANAGREFVAENFSRYMIGKRYVQRLHELGVLSSSICAVSGFAVQRDSVFIHLDRPSLQAIKDTALHGVVEFAGWSVAPSGIRRLDVYCNGEYAGEAVFGMPRPDVNAAYPDYIDSHLSGFYMRFDTTRYANGPVRIQLLAQTHSGAYGAVEIDAIIDNSKSGYVRWLKENALTSDIVADIHRMQSHFGFKPLLSVIVALTGKDELHRVQETFQSLTAQLYPNWEVIIGRPRELAQSINQVIKNIHLSGRTKIVDIDDLTWLDLVHQCTGDFIGVVDPGDRLDPRCLFAVVNTIQNDPEVDFIYTDEDVITPEGHRVQPFFKPAWSPTLFTATNYVGRFWMTRLGLLKDFCVEQKRGSDQLEHQMLLRLLQKTKGVSHIPMVLNSRAQINAKSTSRFMSACAEKPLAIIDGTESSKQSTLDRFESLSKVSIIIPSCLKNLVVIEACFKSILECTAYKNIEVLLVVNNAPSTDANLQFLKKWPFTLLHWDGAYNWSAINNMAAKKASGDYLLFLNDDVEVLNRDWLILMINQARRPEVGAVGAKLLYPNMSIQHAGIVLMNHSGGSKHLFRYCREDEENVQRMLCGVRECSAVTGACLMSRREVFEELGGFDETLPLVCNDTDYCLRAAQAGYSSVLASDAILIHHEALSRAGIPEDKDVVKFWERWGDVLKHTDVYFNPNLDNKRDDWTVNPGAKGILMGRRNLISRLQVKPVCEMGANSISKSTTAGGLV